jgi:hypothetical protein
MHYDLFRSKTRFYTVPPRVIIRHQSARTPARAYPARAKSKILSLEHTLEHTPLEHTPLEHSTIYNTHT